MIDRSRRPESGEPRVFSFPAFERRRLANGIELLVARQSRVPLARVEWVSPAGAWTDPRDRPGLTTFHADLLDEGTEKRTGPEIAAEVEQLGGHLGSGAGWNATVVEAGGLVEHFPAFVDLLSEVVSTPTFPQEEIERGRKRRLAELLRRRSQPSVIADEAFARILYGDSPYGRPLLGEASSVEGFRREDLQECYRRRFLSGGATCIAVGDLDLEATFDRLAEAFAGWSNPEPTPVPDAGPETSPRFRVVIVDRPGSAQTELRVGHPGVPFSHPDRPVLAVLNAILGGKFTSRINLNLREEHGYTYGAFSRFASRKGPGPFFVSTAVANEVAADATGEILGELHRIHDEPVTAEELDDAIRYLLGVFPYTVQTIADRVRRFEEIAIHDLPDDHFQRFLDAIRHVDAPAVLDAAARHLRPDAVTVLACGPADALAPAFRRFGEPEITAASPSPPRNG